MKKLSETLKEMGIDFAFPIEIKNSKGKLTYYEGSNGFLIKHEYDSSGNTTYCEHGSGFWEEREFDSKGRETYYANSNGCKEGTSRSSATCQGKVVEVDGVNNYGMELKKRKDK